jgi:hypothetical protein
MKIQEIEVSQNHVQWQFLVWTTLSVQALVLHPNKNHILRWKSGNLLYVPPEIEMFYNVLSQ